MHPVLFHCAWFTVYTYGFFVALAMGASVWATTRRASAFGFHKTEAVDLLFALFIAGILGARIWYVWQHAEEYRGGLWGVFQIQEGGLVWYGGFFGSVAAGILYARWRGWPVLRFADFFAPILSLAHAIGRIGCFFNGCCFGQRTSSWLGVRLPELGYAVWPTQLIESGLLFVLSWALFQFPFETKRPGRIFFFYLVGYGTIRFFVEFLRGDQTRYFGWTLPQWTSLLLLAGAFALLLRSRKSSS